MTKEELFTILLTALISDNSRPDLIAFCEKQLVKNEKITTKEEKNT